MIITGSTELYGIIGNPVSHSMSPLIHNAAFQDAGLDKAYVAFPVTDVHTALQGCLALGVKGLSVTIPHKQAVIPFLDTIDPVAEKIGAVNTLIFTAGKIHGMNTDWLGANQALLEHMDLSGSSVLLLGAGGSARAIGFGLQEAGATVILANRTAAKARELAAELNCQWTPLAEAGGIQADALVNATSVGMKPDANSIPVDPHILPNFKVVMDIVYSPMQTRLLNEAKKSGCQTVNGLTMLLYQGAAQFTAWTGRDAPLEVMQKALLNTLQG